MRYLLQIMSVGVIFSVGVTGCASSQNHSESQYQQAPALSDPANPPTVTEKDNSNIPASGSNLPELNDDSTLSDYLAYAALNNPGLEAAFNRWKASIESIAQTESLPDPRLTYQYYIEEVETRVGPQRQSIGISQTLPWFGKLDLGGKVAQQAANAEQQQYEAAKLKLFYDVKDAYAEYYYLGQAISIFRDNVALVRHLEEVARTRFKAAAASHPDIIKAQVELGKLEDQLKSLEEFKSPLLARLNAALNRPTDAEIPWPKELSNEEIAVADDIILEQLVESSPDLKSMDFEIQKNKHKIQLAQKNYYPDITLGLNYIDTDDSSMSPPPKDNGKDPLIAMVSINLPLWQDKYDAGLRQARAQYYASQRSKENKVNDLKSMLKMTLYKVHDAERKIDLYQNALIPKAQQSLKVTESDYQAGKVGFLDFIDTQRVLLEFDLAYQRALANHAQSLARAEMLIGREITSEKN